MDVAAVAVFWENRKASFKFARKESISIEGFTEFSRKPFKNKKNVWKVFQSSTFQKGFVKKSTMLWVAWAGDTHQVLPFTWLGSLKLLAIRLNGRKKRK